MFPFCVTYTLTDPTTTHPLFVCSEEDSIKFTARAPSEESEAIECGYLALPEHYCIGEAIDRLNRYVNADNFYGCLNDLWIEGTAKGCAQQALALGLSYCFKKEDM
jgi:hypothetical protein